jgi:hypothetical protein
LSLQKRVEMRADEIAQRTGDRVDVSRPKGRAGDAPLIVMVHPLGGMRGPARTLIDLAGYLAGRWDVLVAVPEDECIRRTRDLGIEEGNRSTRESPGDDPARDAGASR